MKNLTDKQSRIYEFIVACQRKNGYPPTQAEIRHDLKFGNLNSVRGHLARIEKKGYIRLNCGKARGIQVLSPSPFLRQREGSIPLLGTIAAGVPIWAEQNVEAYLPIPPAFFGGDELFALRVSGDSMIGAGIRNGDIAVIRKQDCVDDGEIAAVLIEQEATLKRVYSSSGLLVLKAENPDFKELRYTKSEIGTILILGRYQGILRTRNNRWIP
ncbi:MAG: transcriptional repressor LexA [Syntrophobacteraceae bacterium]